MKIEERMFEKKNENFKLWLIYLKTHPIVRTIKILENERRLAMKEVDNTKLTKKHNEWFSKNAQHLYYMKKIEKWWKTLSEEDKMDVYDNMVDFLK